MDRGVTSYYNEFDKKTAAWLRELIKRGLIADGIVDERCITEVTPNDLRGFDQCHFFAGIGGWSAALRLAGWTDTRPVWTGSPPCQPFSAAGQRKGAADARNLWPVYVCLVAQCRPSTLFGEQVAAAISTGWLDAVCADLESEGYACAATVLPACGVGAPHIRQRLWFVANAQSIARKIQLPERRPQQAVSEPRGTGATGIVADTADSGTGRPGPPESSGDGKENGIPRTDSGSATNGFWADAIWLPCRDGKGRPTKPGLFPLADGIPGRVGLLRGAGNAIVPQVAAEVIGAYMDITA